MDRRSEYLLPKQLGGLGFIDAAKRLQQAAQGQHGNDPICLKPYRNRSLQSKV